MLSLHLEDLESAVFGGHLIDKSPDVQAETANHHLHAVTYTYT